MLSSAQVHLVTPHGLTLWDWLHAGLIVVATIMLSQLVRKLTLRAFGAHHERAAARISARFGAYLVVAAGLVYALSALRVQIGPLIGALGIGGIALAFALQDILQNLVAGVILQARRPIRHGDQIEVGKFQGTVLDIDLRNVLVRTYDGLDVFLPNRVVIEGAIVNYTMTPMRRLALEIGVAYGADLREVQRRLVEAATGVPSVAAEPAPAAWCTGFGESSIAFTLLFWFRVTEHSNWEVRSDVAMAVKASLDAGGIDMPFPQRTLSLEPGAADVLGQWANDRLARIDGRSLRD
jgi:small conductance mechanosensitive channel